MTKAVFLDRDGVINKEIGDYAYKEKDFVINEGVLEFLQFLTDKQFIIIIISNQGGIGRGIYTKETVEKLHNRMLSYFSANRVTIHEIYYCPHHPETGKCLCRKPESLMIEKAIARFSIDREQSFLIGDTERDIQSAGKCGIRAIQIKPNENLNHFRKQIEDETSI
jgi:D-glycero-D-manno-heptose 1,7-bisphosphate phosphatase